MHFVCSTFLRRLGLGVIILNPLALGGETVDYLLILFDW